MTTAPHDPGDIPPESNWPYDPPAPAPQVPRELLDLAARRFFGADTGEPMAVSLEAVVAEVATAVRDRVEAEILASRARVPDVTVDDKILRTGMALAARVVALGGQLWTARSGTPASPRRDGSRAPPQPRSGTPASSSCGGRGASRRSRRIWACASGRRGATRRGGRLSWRGRWRREIRA